MLSENEINFLSKIGLSMQEIVFYDYLEAQQKSLKVSELGVGLGILPNALYRIISKLTRYGLIVVTGRPKKVQSTPKNVALPLAQQMHFDNLSKLLKEDSVSSRDSAIHAVLVGRQQVYDYYINEVYRAQQSVDIYAIGIAYSDVLYKAQLDALKRGVKLRHIFQKLEPSNYYVAHKWREMGVDVRILKKQQGYHLFVIDNNLAAVTFSSTKNTEQRLSIVLKGGVTSIFSDQFQYLWQHSSIFKNMQ